MAITSPPAQLPGGLTPPQYRWLKARLGSASDIQACLELGVSKNTLRHWKRIPYFRRVAQSIREDRYLALRLLGLHLTGAVLEALERLLQSDKTLDLRLAWDMWKSLEAPKGETPEVVDPVEAILSMLRLRNAPGEVIEAASVRLLK